MGINVIVAVIAYLLGSIPFGYILLRVFRGEDVRQHGSGNIGATNVARKAPVLGIATLVLDAMKGYAAVYLAWRIANSSWNGIQYMGDYLGYAVYHYPESLMAVAAVFAVVGHMFPIWLRFKGGKGVATGVGTFVALAPKAVLVVVVLFVVLVIAFRYVSLGSIVSTAAFPVVAFFMYKNDVPLPSFFIAIGVVAALIILKHHENIRRLLSGTENRFELKRR